MQTVVSAKVGTTARGLPRYSGCSCCSTDAKKLLRSMWRKWKRSGWAGADTARTGYYILLLFAFGIALDDVVGDAERVAEVEGVLVFAEDLAAVDQQGLLCGADI